MFVFVGLTLEASATIRGQGGGTSFGDALDPPGPLLLLLLLLPLLENVPGRVVDLGTPRWWFDLGGRAS